MNKIAINNIKQTQEQFDADLQNIKQQYDDLAAKISTTNNSTHPQPKIENSDDVKNENSDQPTTNNNTNTRGPQKLPWVNKTNPIQPQQSNPTQQTQPKQSNPTPTHDELKQYAVVDYRDSVLSSTDCIIVDRTYKARENTYWYTIDTTSGL
jgi:hypothetical protein